MVWDGHGGGYPSFSAFMDRTPDATVNQAASRRFRCTSRSEIAAGVMPLTRAA